jgi:hypothetical protein
MTQKEFDLVISLIDSRLKKQLLNLKKEQYARSMTNMTLIDLKITFTSIYETILKCQRNCDYGRATMVGETCHFIPCRECPLDPLFCDTNSTNPTAFKFRFSSVDDFLEENNEISFL